MEISLMRIVPPEGEGAGTGNGSGLWRDGRSDIFTSVSTRSHQGVILNSATVRHNLDTKREAMGPGEAPLLWRIAPRCCQYK